MLKKSEDENIKADLAAGISAAERVLTKANEAVDRDLLDQALDDLINRVDDWKNHKVEQFGKLLLHGVYTVVTGKSEQEKDYEIYLFECILLCCKEVTPTKSKDKKDKTKSTGPKIRSRSAKLQLKGRIFMTNVTEVISFAKPGKPTSSLGVNTGALSNTFASQARTQSRFGGRGTREWKISSSSSRTMTR